MRRGLRGHRAPARDPEPAARLKFERPVLELLETVLRYLTAASERVTEEVIERALLTAFPDAGGTVMATAGHRAGHRARTAADNAGQYHRRAVIRFGATPEQLIEAVQRITDPSTLQSLLHQAVTAESLDAFESSPGLKPRG
jgi:hypothetical protein